MSLLSDNEIRQIHINLCNTVGSHYKTVARATEAAILAKLEGSELPEPAIKACQYQWNNGGAELHPKPVTGYTADQLTAWGNTRYAQGFAAGAAAQLAEKPSAFQLRDEEASEHYGREIYVLYSVCDFKDGANIEKIGEVLTPLYTRREA